MPSLIHQELERAGVGVLHRLGGVDDEAAHLAADLVGQRRRRRFLDQLLMAALDRALALAEMHDVAVVVAEDLELDVARVLEILLDVDVAVAERGLGLRAARCAAALGSSPRIAHDAHAAAAAAGHRLDDDRIADFLGDLERLLLAARPGRRCPGSIGTPAFFIAFFARALSPSSLITLGSGPMNRMWQASQTSAR